jgi:hypothetical protein
LTSQSTLKTKLLITKLDPAKTLGDQEQNTKLDPSKRPVLEPLGLGDQFRHDIADRWRTYPCIDAYPNRGDRSWICPINALRTADADSR